METARDIVIIILGIETILVQLILGGLLIFLVARINSLIKEKIEPFLDTARETAVTVKGTSSFVSETVVDPIIKVASFAAGVRKAVNVVFGGSKERR